MTSQKEFLVRFLMKVVIDYPTKEEEKLIIRMNMQPGGFTTPNAICDPNDILKARNVVRQIYMDEKIEQYIIDIVFASRYPKQYGLDDHENLVSFGASPRASIWLILAAKAHALLNERGYVLPKDVKKIAKDVLRHRVLLTYEAEAENISSDVMIEKILDKIKVP